VKVNVFSALTRNNSIITLIKASLMHAITSNPQKTFRFLANVKH